MAFEIHKKKCLLFTGVASTLYNPIRDPLPEASERFVASLRPLLSTQSVQPQIFQLLPDDWPVTVQSNVGDVPAGSTLSHQQAVSGANQDIITVGGAPERPKCPRPTLASAFETASLDEDLSMLYAGISCTMTQSEDYEQSTRLQSECPEWKQLRSMRLTASRFPMPPTPRPNL